MNTVVLYIYVWMFIFVFGWLLGLDAAKGKVSIGDISVDAFFAMIWPVTIAIYISEKVKDAHEKKGGGNEK